MLRGSEAWKNENLNSPLSRGYDEAGIQPPACSHTTSYLSPQGEHLRVKKMPLQPLRRYKAHKHWRGVTPQNETQESRYTYRKV
jgi:hypothetical protein